MDQVIIDFDTLPADACDRTGFELGWDHAHHGLVPPAELLLDGTPVSQGWRAARAVFGRRTLAATRPVRQWLALRTSAWRRGIVFEGTQVTAHFLAQIETPTCPVTRQPLGGAPGSADAPVVTRLQSDAGYAAGNLALLSQRAADAMAGLDTREALRRAARVDAGIEPTPDGLAVADVWRLAVLMSFVTPLPFVEAVRVPLRVLPPNRVRLLNAAQGLQALLTLQFSHAGWSARARALADLLPAPDLRHDFNLFVGALAPRWLEAGHAHDTRAVRRTLEDAWADERVNRRWRPFVLALGEAGTEALLARAAEAGLAGVRTLLHESTQATEGWSLASRGRVPVWPRQPRGRRPPAPQVNALRG
jgi:hypothetical protein